jgi:hypothetical protein
MVPRSRLDPIEQILRARVDADGAVCQRAREVRRMRQAGRLYLRCANALEPLRDTDSRDLPAVVRAMLAELWLPAAKLTAACPLGVSINTHGSKGAFGTLVSALFVRTVQAQPTDKVDAIAADQLTRGISSMKRSLREGRMAFESLAEWAGMYSHNLRFDYRHQLGWKPAISLGPYSFPTGDLEPSAAAKKRGTTTSRSTAVDGSEQAESIRPVDDVPRTLDVAIASDGTWLRVGTKRYQFSKGNQARAVLALFAEWERGGRADGASLSAESLGEAVRSSAGRFRVSTTFHGHEAWNTILRSPRKGVYALYLAPVSRSVAAK